MYTILLNSCTKQNILHVVPADIINPRRACAERVTVVVSCVCVCLYVCLSAHVILAVRAIKKYNERCHRVKRQICGNIKMAFSFQLSYSKVRASFAHLGRGGHL